MRGEKLYVLCQTVTLSMTVNDPNDFKSPIIKLGVDLLIFGTGEDRHFKFELQTDHIVSIIHDNLS